MDRHMAPPLHMNATCGPVHRTEMAGVEAASNATPLVLFQDALRELDLGDQAPGRRHARVITECTPPFRIVHVNKAWEELCGFYAEDAIGRTFGELMQGPGTSARTLKELGAATAAGRPTTQLLLNYKKGGEAFINLLQVRCSPCRARVRSPLRQTCIISWWSSAPSCNTCECIFTMQCTHPELTSPRAWHR